MPNLSIKDVPEALAEALRQRAARNHRSLQGELMAIVEHAANEPPLVIPAEAAAPDQARGIPRPQGTVVGHDRFGRAILRRGSKTIEQIYAEHLERFPEPFTEGPMSVDIIREDRDSR